MPSGFSVAHFVHLMVPLFHKNYRESIARCEKSLLLLSLGESSYFSRAFLGDILDAFVQRDP